MLKTLWWLLCILLLNLNWLSRQPWGHRSQAVFLWRTDPINILRKMELSLPLNTSEHFRMQGTSPHGSSHTFLWPWLPIWITNFMWVLLFKDSLISSFKIFPPWIVLSYFLLEALFFHDLVTMIERLENNICVQHFNFEHIFIIFYAL